MILTAATVTLLARRLGEGKITMKYAREVIAQTAIPTEGHKAVGICCKWDDMKHCRKISTFLMHCRDLADLLASREHYYADIAERDARDTRLREAAEVIKHGNHLFLMNNQLSDVHNMLKHNTRELVEVAARNMKVSIVPERHPVNPLGYVLIGHKIHKILNITVNKRGDRTVEHSGGMMFAPFGEQIAWFMPEAVRDPIEPELNKLKADAEHLQLILAGHGIKPHEFEKAIDYLACNGHMLRYFTKIYMDYIYVNH